MAAKPVQISLDPELLRLIDTDPETCRSGRSEFIRSAVRLYLKAKERRRVDQAIERAFGGKSDELLEEAEALMRSQAWPVE